MEEVYNSERHLLYVACTRAGTSIGYQRRAGVGISGRSSVKIMRKRSPLTSKRLREAWSERSALPRCIHHGNLIVQRPEIVQVADPQQARGAQVNDPRHPLAHVEAVHAEKPEKGKQHPRDGVVDAAGAEAQVGFAVHAGNQEQVDQPADAEQAQGEEPEGAGNRPAVVEAVGAGEAEDPEDVADGLGVGIVGGINMVMVRGRRVPAY